MAFFARLLRTAVATGFREADAGWRTGGAEQLPATRRKRSGSEICHCMHSSAEPSRPTSSSGTFTPPWLYSISCGWLKRIQPGKGGGTALPIQGNLWKAWIEHGCAMMRVVSPEGQVVGPPTITTAPGFPADDRRRLDLMIYGAMPFGWGFFFVAMRSSFRHLRQ